MTRSATTPPGWQPGATIARAATLEPASYDQAARTIEAVFSTGARVRRWGAFEELDLSPEAVNLSRVAGGLLPLLDTHDQGRLDAVLGTVTEARLENNALVGRIAFADTDRGRDIEARVARGELGAISIGYRVDQWTAQVPATSDDPEIWRATRWELLEVSLVPVPADPAAKVRSLNPENGDMSRSADPAATPAVIEDNPTRAAPAAPPPVATPAPDLTAERRRAADLMDIGRRAGLPDADVTAAITDGTTVDAFRARAFDALAARQPSVSAVSPVTVTRDEGDTLRRGIEDALTVRFGAVGENGRPVAPSEQARGFLDLSLVQMAADVIGHRGHVPASYAGREQMLARAMHSTSDFPVLLENAMNRTMQSRYALQAPTYRQLARSRTYVDFRPHQAVRAGDFPNLVEVGEGGEIKAGAVPDAVKEQTSVKAYGVTLSFSRQLLVNDSLGGVAQVLADYGNKVALFEESTFYAMFLSASGAGPTLLEVNRAVFHASNGNLAGAGTVLDETNITTARTAFRNQKRRDGEFIDVVPRILLVGPSRFVSARKLVTDTTPVKADDFNPFSGAFTVVETPRITTNAWYLFASPADLPCFEYGLLEGYTAPRMRMDEPFGKQGMSVSLEHDFGCGAIDYRGVYRNPGN